MAGAVLAALGAAQLERWAAFANPFAMSHYDSLATKEASMTYFVYENWRAHGHKAKIHTATCRFCNNGKGIQVNASDDNGTWH